MTLDYLKEAGGVKDVKIQMERLIVETSKPWKFLHDVCD